MRERGWVEYSVYPLFSPQSLIAEGTANYGIEVAFPQRGSAARSSVTCCSRWPGSIRRRAKEYYDVLALVDRLSYAGNEAARRYLTGPSIVRPPRPGSSATRCIRAPRAEQRVRFIDQYRSYVINYNLGKDLVRAYVEKQAGPQRDNAGTLARVCGAAVLAAVALGPAVMTRTRRTRRQP